MQKVTYLHAQIKHCILQKMCNYCYLLKASVTSNSQLGKVRAAWKLKHNEYF
jgi:hypothetical protein